MVHGTQQYTNVFGTWNQSPAEQGDLDRLAVEQSVVTWHPSSADSPVRDIAWDVLRFRDSNRRFFPRQISYFEEHAALAGREILERIGFPEHDPCPLNPEQRRLYRLMALVRSRALKGAEFIARHFDSKRDLYVTPSGQGGGIDNWVLPEMVLGTNERRNSLTPAPLLEAGYEAARSAGIDQPTNGQCITYGLNALATAYPLENLLNDQVKSIVLQSLFDVSKSSQVASSEIVNEVQDRLCLRMEKHQNDADKRFFPWFAGSRSNIAKSLCAMKGREKLPREVVTAALLQISWRSFDYFANCLAAFSRAFMLSLPEPMNDVERQNFSAIFLPQPYFGGFPLVMIMQRSEIIAPLIPKLLSRPTDRRLHAILHRLLAMYADIVTKRRAADRQVKRVAGTRIQVQEIANLQDRDSKEQRSSENHSSILRCLVEKKRQGCPQCAVSSDWEIIAHSAGNRVTLEVRCARHEFHGECITSVAEIQAEVRDSR